MILSLKKGVSHINVDYVDGDFSGNLYCSDTKYIDGQVKTIELDFRQILKSKTEENSKDDLNDLTSRIDFLDSICFSDNTIKKKLWGRLKQNEKVLVRIISQKTLEVEMTIKFKSGNEFILNKTSN
jgi:hypothetical protein